MVKKEEKKEKVYFILKLGDSKVQVELPKESIDFSSFLNGLREDIGGDVLEFTVLDYEPSALFNVYRWLGKRTGEGYIGLSGTTEGKKQKGQKFTAKELESIENDRGYIAPDDLTFFQNMFQHNENQFNQPMVDIIELFLLSERLGINILSQELISFIARQIIPIGEKAVDIPKGDQNGEIGAAVKEMLTIEAATGKLGQRVKQDKTALKRQFKGNVKQVNAIYDVQLAWQQLFQEAPRE